MAWTTRNPRLWGSNSEFPIAVVVTLLPLNSGPPDTELIDRLGSPYLHSCVIATAHLQPGPWGRQITSSPPPRRARGARGRDVSVAAQHQRACESPINNSLPPSGPPRLSFLLSSSVRPSACSVSVRARVFCTRYYPGSVPKNSAPPSSVRL